MLSHYTLPPIRNWSEFQSINNIIWDLYQVYCEDFPDAKKVLERRIKDTTPEFLFIFYEDEIGIHTYLAGHYWPITISFSDEKSDPKVSERIKELIKILAEYVSRDKLGGQMGLDDNETNKKNAYINWKWVPKNTDPASPAPTEKPVAGS